MPQTRKAGIYEEQGHGFNEIRTPKPDPLRRRDSAERSPKPKGTQRDVGVRNLSMNHRGRARSPLRAAAGRWGARKAKECRTTIAAGRGLTALPLAWGSWSQ